MNKHTSPKRVKLIVSDNDAVINVRVPSELRNMVDFEAERQGVPISTVVKLALIEYLSIDTMKMKET